MAESLAHRWGQIIGEVFETFVERIIAGVANRHGLFLDRKGPRAVRSSAKVCWQDGYGNKHDLDYVLERGGTDSAFGTPVAFIESAWRRYTKHSRNKVQEIEAAVMPIALTFSRHQPFCGAVLAGEFTCNALRQLESKGFGVLHVPYSSILSAFAELGIDAASEDGAGGTTEAQFRKKISGWKRQPQPAATDKLLAHWNRLHAGEIARFVERLEASLTRRVLSVRLTVLRGHTVECRDILDAIEYLIEEENSSRLREGSDEREAFEVQVRFNTDARIEATFTKRAEAIAFLRTFA
jgi:hypothetical protein